MQTSHYTQKIGAFEAWSSTSNDVWRVLSLQLITYLMTVNRYKVFSVLSAWSSTSTNSERCYLCLYLNIWTGFSHPVLFTQMAVKTPTACCLMSLWGSLPSRSAKIRKLTQKYQGCLINIDYLIDWSTGSLLSLSSQPCSTLNTLWSEYYCFFGHPLQWSTTSSPTSVHFRVRTVANPDVSKSSRRRETVINWAVTISKCLTSSVSD